MIEVHSADFFPNKPTNAYIEFQNTECEHLYFPVLHFESSWWYRHAIRHPLWPPHATQLRSSVNLVLGVRISLRHFVFRVLLFQAKIAVRCKISHRATRVDLVWTWTWFGHKLVPREDWKLKVFGVTLVFVVEIMPSLEFKSPIQFDWTWTLFYIVQARYVIMPLMCSVSVYWMTDTTSSTLKFWHILWKP